MRAHYATHKHIRVFAFGVPEGWLVSAYDLLKHQWVDRCDCVSGTLREAKINGEQKAAELIGKKILEMKWH